MSVPPAAGDLSVSSRSTSHKHHYQLCLPSLGPGCVCLELHHVLHLYVCCQQGFSVWVCSVSGLGNVKYTHERTARLILWPLFATKCSQRVTAKDTEESSLHILLLPRLLFKASGIFLLLFVSQQRAFSSARKRVTLDMSILFPHLTAAENI